MCDDGITPHKATFKIEELKDNWIGPVLESGMRRLHGEREGTAVYESFTVEAHGRIWECRITVKKI